MDMFSKLKERSATIAKAATAAAQKVLVSMQGCCDVSFAGC